jgi:vacuolar-type H+-ATPase subunit F/Vma7
MEGRGSTPGSSLNDRTKVAIIGDEEAITGFSLTGINQESGGSYKPFAASSMYMYSVKGNTTDEEIAGTFRDMVGKKEVAMVLISRTVADRIREEVSKKRDAIPVVLEMPGKGEKSFF